VTRDLARPLREAWIVDAVRTPIGRYGGALASVRPDDLAALVIGAIVERTGIDPAVVEDVILGCANQAGEDNRNVARMAVLLAGLPVEVAGQTVNRLCGSGLQAVNAAAHAIAVGDGDVVIAGGVESMTRAPYVALKPAEPYARGTQELVDSTLGWRFVNPRMAETYPPISLGETAERVAAQWAVSRERQDAFALESQRRAVAAIEVVASTASWSR
jgi:acetyl-CoA acetyltransferase family protein